MIMLGEHIGTQKLWQVSVDITGILKSRREEINISNMLQKKAL